MSYARELPILYTLSRSQSQLVLSVAFSVRNQNLTPAMLMKSYGTG
jgi:hypothetical protein